MKRSHLTAFALAAALFLVQPNASAGSPEVLDLTQKFRAAAPSIDRLQVYEVAGVVIIRGRTTDKALAEQAGRHARELGYTRVANLIQISVDDDAAITKRAEVELGVHRSLDGCRFRVYSSHGVVRVAGLVHHELQKDVAVQVLRQIDGVRRVETDLKKF